MINPQSYTLASNSDDELLLSLEREARDFLLGHRWCDDVGSIYVGLSGWAVVFLAEIQSSESGVDPQVWVISGELPLCYMDIQSCTDSYSALGEYCMVMYSWASDLLKSPPVHNPLELSEHRTFRRLRSIEEAAKCIKVCYRLASWLLLHERPKLEPELVAELIAVQKVTGASMER